MKSEDLGGYFHVPPDLRDLNYGKFMEQGEIEISQSTDYNSYNTEQLDVAGMQELLMKLASYEKYQSVVIYRGG